MPIACKALHLVTRQTVWPVFLESNGDSKGFDMGLFKQMKGLKETVAVVYASRVLPGASLAVMVSSGDPEAVAIMWDAPVA